MISWKDSNSAAENDISSPSKTKLLLLDYWGKWHACFAHQILGNSIQLCVPLSCKNDKIIFISLLFFFIFRGIFLFYLLSKEDIASSIHVNQANP